MKTTRRSLSVKSVHDRLSIEDSESLCYVGGRGPERQEEPGRSRVVVCRNGIYDRFLPMSELGTNRQGARAFEWGYAGVAPAALAHSILIFELRMGRVLAEDPLSGLGVREVELEHVYHDFEDRIIATWPDAGGKINSRQVRAWLADAIKILRAQQHRNGETRGMF